MLLVEGKFQGYGELDFTKCSIRYGRLPTSWLNCNAVVARLALWEKYLPAGALAALDALYKYGGGRISGARACDCA